MPANHEFVGWVDQREWESVYQDIFYGDKERIRHGLDVIEVWKCRYAGRVPVAIEATSQIVQCRLLNSDSVNKRQSMATAISQFVGLVTERALKGRVHAVPMRVRGEQFGIPQWITSLRHDVAHNFIPSYNLLEKATEFALKWLKIHHWEEHLKINRNRNTTGSEKTDDGSLIELLRSYIFPHRKKSLPIDFNMDSSDLNSLIRILVQHNFFTAQSYTNGNSRCFEPHIITNRFQSLLKRLNESDHLKVLLSTIHSEVQYPYISKEQVSILLKSIIEISNDSCFDSYSVTPSTEPLQKASSMSNACCMQQDGNAEETLPAESWTLYGSDMEECLLGIMPGQTKLTLWQDLHGGSPSNQNAEGEQSCNAGNPKEPAFDCQIYDFDLV